MKHDPRMQGFRERTAVATVETLLQARLTPLAAQVIAPTTGAGRVLAEDILAPRDLPAFDRSAMDGYAVRGEDTFGASEYAPRELKVIGRCVAGQQFDGAINAGECVKIMTGAPIPAGANAVLPAELSRVTASEASQIHAIAAVPPQKHISQRGEDVASASTILCRGRRLRPQDLALLSASGITAISVVRTPSIDIIATGDELLPPGSVPQGAQIVDANSPMLEALARADGADIASCTAVGDDFDTIRDAIASCRGDAVVISGGSSVGEEDHVPRVVDQLGELAVHGIAMRPSSPTGIGFIDERPIFLTPGNPVSCLCAYDFFVGPSLRLLGGRSWHWPHRQLQLPLAQKITSVSGRVDYARVTITNSEVAPLMVSGAAILSSATRADGVVIVPHDDEGIAAGVEVTVFLYD